MRTIVRVLTKDLEALLIMDRLFNKLAEGSHGP